MQLSKLKPGLGKTYQQGFSLTEVLVSVVILSVGLLGMAGMQTAAYRVNHDSFVRSTALSQVEFIVDKMRANKIARKAGQYEEASTQMAQQQETMNPDGSYSMTNIDCEEDCTTQDIAVMDVTQWNDDTARLLPSGRGRISSNGNIYTITIMWDKNRTGASGEDCSGNTAVDLTCLRINVEL